MRICFESPMAELRELLTEASGKKGVFITVTKSEMNAIVKHAEAKELFPSYFNRVGTRKQQIELKLSEIKKRLNSPTLAANDQQAHWDDQSRLEKQLRGIEDEVPSELRSIDDVVVRVSMLA